MFSARIDRARRSLAWRFSILFTAVFAAALITVFAGYLVVLEQNLSRQLDASMLAEISEYGALLDSRGGPILQEVLDQEAISEGTDRMFFRLLDNGGQVIFQTEMRAWPEYTLAHADLAAANAGGVTFQTVDSEDGASRTRVMTAALTPDIIFQMGDSLGEKDALLQSFRRLFAGGFVVVVLLSGSCTYLVLRRMLQRVDDVTSAARNIARGQLSQRVQTRGSGDEIDLLATTFNTMIEHNQTLIRNLKEVTDDIAHDLRSPLTCIRGTAELALQDTGLKDPQTRVLGTIIEECDRLLRLINTMLEIAQTESGLARLAISDVNLRELVRDVVDFFEPAADDKHIRLTMDANSPVEVRCDRDRLHQVIAQLLDNAIKYTPEGGNVDVTCTIDGRDVKVTVQDSGIGIAEADLAHIFSRFYRGDASRSSQGNGLGLSLVHAIVEAHQGSVSVKSSPGKGSLFELRLPRSPAASTGGAGQA